MNIRRSILVLIPVLFACFAAPLLYSETPSGSILDFPRFNASTGNDSGIAIFNPTSESASVSLSLTALDGTSISTPISLIVPPLGQVAKTQSELFSLGNLNSSLRITSPVPGITAVVEAFDAMGTYMDGVSAGTVALDVVFPVVPGTSPGSTEISILNSNRRATSVRLKLRTLEGAILGEALVYVPTFGSYRISLQKLYPSVSDFTSASHITATSVSKNIFFPPQAISGSSLFASTLSVSGSSDLAALNSIPISEGVHSGAIPFFRADELFSSVLSIANFEDSGNTISATFITADGSAFATKTLSLPANGGFRGSIEALFPSYAQLRQEGWILLQASGRIAAATLLGRHDTGGFTAIPMQRLPQVSFAFPQIVQGSGFFTELSLANPGPNPSSVEIFVIGAGGATSAITQIDLSPGTWVSKRLDQFLPELERLSGSILYVRASNPIFGTAIIWSDSGKIAANITPALVPNSYFPSALEHFAVSGSVTLNGQFIEGIPVLLSSPSGIATTQTREDGLFVFTGLLGGDYALHVDQFGFQFNPSQALFSITTASIRQDFRGFTKESGILVVPSSIPVGSADTVVIIHGNSFTSSSKAFVGPVEISTTYVSSTELRANLLSYLFAAAGTFEIRVLGDTGTSEPYKMVVYTQKPQLAGITTTREIVEGSPAAAIALSGSGFLDGAKIKINGKSDGIAINHLTDGEIIASVPSSYFDQGGVYPVTVENPFPATIESNVQLLTVFFPRPAIESISPAVIQERLEDSSAPQILQLFGYGFRKGAVVLFEGEPVPTSYCEETSACLTQQLTATIDAGLLRSSGFKRISVKNPDPSLAPSLIIFLRVEGLQPTVTSAFPGSATILNLPEPNNRYTLPVLVYGTNFDSKAEVQFTSPLGITSGFIGASEVISSNQLVAELEILYPDSIGEWMVEVKNPQPGGGRSKEFAYFQITQGSFTENPFLISISPDTVPAGSPSFTLTVTGANFKEGSQINFFSRPLPTVFIDSTQLRAEVPASAVRTAGKQPISVTNPDNGGTSNQVFIEVQ